MGISPAVAIPNILAKTGLSKEDIDVWEVGETVYGVTFIGMLMVLPQINEAFASQFAYCVEQLQIPIEKINPK